MNHLKHITKKRLFFRTGEICIVYGENCNNQGIIYEKACRGILPDRLCHFHESNMYCLPVVRNQAPTFFPKFFHIGNQNFCLAFAAYLDMITQMIIFDSLLFFWNRNTDSALLLLRSRSKNTTRTLTVHYLTWSALSSSG